MRDIFVGCGVGLSASARPTDRVHALGNIFHLEAAESTNTNSNAIVPFIAI